MTASSTFDTRVNMGTISRGMDGSDMMEQHLDNKKFSIMVRGGGWVGGWVSG